MTRQRIVAITKTISVIAGVLLLLYGAVAAVLGRTPVGDASTANRVSGLVMVLVAFLWILPNPLLYRVRFPTVVILTSFGAYGIYSLARLINSGMWPDSDGVAVWLIVIAVLPFVPIVSLVLATDQGANQP